MIARTPKGEWAGLIRYLFGPGKGNEHTHQRVITRGS